MCQLLRENITDIELTCSLNSNAGAKKYLMARLTASDFIKQSTIIHEGKYTYDDISYNNLSSKITIKCPEHGDFTQVARAHFSGRGCKKCVSDKLRMTLDNFTERASIKHNGKYDYSNVEYKTTDTKVCIACPIHGQFYQTPYNHLKGKKCPECSGVRKYSRSHFFKKAREIHGVKYTYELSNKLNAKAKISIRCIEHGIFKQTIDSHINRGSGCPMCAGNIKWNVDDFLAIANETHNGVYDYSAVLTLRSGAQSILDIYCLKHGFFRKRANLHAHGSGCPTCQKEVSNVGVKVITLKKQKSEEPSNNNSVIRERVSVFLKKSKEIHEDYYDYSKSIYTNCNTKIEIVCPKHGSFWQSPKHHQAGVGCYECGRLKADKSRSLGIEEFINRSNAIHENKYDYRDVILSKVKDFVTITCAEHGRFRQTADSHMRGAGCRKCAIENSIGAYHLSTIRKSGFSDSPASLYLMKFHDENESFLKIGITRNTKGHRFKKTEAGYIVFLVYAFRTKLENAYTIEQRLLEKFLKHKYLPERSFGGHSECINIQALDELKKEFSSLMNSLKPVH
jgi:hypothetical protein